MASSNNSIKLLQKILSWRAVLPSVVIILIFVFQNCSEPLEISEQDSSSYLSTLPFAFDTELDTIAYMSCSNMGTDYNSRAYFTIRAGAYFSGSGIKISDEYLQATSNFSPSRRVEGLQESGLNSAAQLQIALRSRSELSSYITGSQSGDATEGRDYSNLVAPLDSPAIAERLITQTQYSDAQRINYFSGISGLGGRLVEGDLRFLDSETTAGSVRDHLRSTAFLSLTYGDGLAADDLHALKMPDESDRRRAYGKGYQIDFRMGFGVDNTNATNRPIYTKGIHRVINSIQEVDLLRRTPTEADIRPWTCSNNSTFIIVRPEDVDAGKVTCLRFSDPVNPTGNDKIALTALRQVLRAEDWWVDLGRRCVIPKQGNGSCYGSVANNSTPINVKYNGGDCTAAGQTCPHYVSICLRN